MIIGIDGNLLTGKKTGMGHVVETVLLNFPKSENIIYLFVKESLNSSLYKTLKNNGINVVILEKKNYFIWEQIILPKAIKNYNIEIFWSPYNTSFLNKKCKTVISIHDTIYMDTKLKSVPTLYKKIGLLYRRLIVPKVSKKADYIITGSEFAKIEIINKFRIHDEKIHVIYDAIENQQEVNDSHEFLEFVSKNNVKEYILGFGSLEKRKNSFRLIKAFQKVQTNAKLVLFGFRGFEKSEEYKYVLKNNIQNVIFLSYVSNDMKRDLFSNALFFVFPSLSEGFGLPILEAFQNNCAVICSNTTSLPEVGGDAVIYIDPKNIESISNAIDYLLSNTIVQNQLIQKGKNRLSLFSKETMATKTYNILLNRDL